MSDLSMLFMIDGKRFICDFCGNQINGNVVIEVESVRAEGERFDRHCISEGENLRYFHLATDRKADFYDFGGCYKQWTVSKECYTPHGVRAVLKSDVLAKLTD